VGEIVGMELTIEQPNASHLTAVLHKQTWYLLFDFRYNATRVSGFHWVLTLLHPRGADHAARPVNTEPGVRPCKR
jgi:hypothetical protein